MRASSEATKGVPCDMRPVNGEVCELSSAYWLLDCKAGSSKEAYLRDESFIGAAENSLPEGVRKAYTSIEPRGYLLVTMNAYGETSEKSSTWRKAVDTNSA